MRPSARLRAVEELLEPLCKSPEFPPFNQTLGTYFRKRRYIGARDRRAIRETAYLILRLWQVLAFALKKAGAPLSGRSLVLAFMTFNRLLKDDLFREGKYGLKPLSEAEKGWLSKLDPGREVPEWAAGNCPEWLFSHFKERFGENTGTELEALNQRAGPELRINTLNPAPENLENDLKELGFVRGSLVKGAWTSPEETNLNHCKHYKNGIIEIQDQGSQLASLLAAAKPDMQVLDLCSGAGGKTLSMAATMQNTGQIFAFDVAPEKIRELKTRVQRAGVRNVQAEAIPPAGAEREKILKPFREKMDLVLLDVPCSGTGVWRRHPDARLRLTPEKLKAYQNVQDTLLEEGCQLVRPGGRLVYVTCSLLAVENEKRVERVMKNAQALKPLDFRRCSAARDLKSLSRLDWALQLSPGSHGVDGFFVARFEKAGANK